MQIRVARPFDGPAIIELVRGLASYEKLQPPTPAAAERLLAALESSKLEMLVADDGGTIVAYAAFFETFSTFLAKPTLFLEDLFVDPASRSAGIGKAMMAELRTVAESRGCGRFEWTVLDWNEGAQRFYRNLGAEILDDWRVVRITL